MITVLKNQGAFFLCREALLCSNWNVPRGSAHKWEMTELVKGGSQEEEIKCWEGDDVRIPATTFLSLLPGHPKGATASPIAS